MPADIDPTTRTGTDQTETAAEALRLLDRAEQPVRLTGERTDDWQRPKNYEAAGATLEALLADVDNHKVRVPVAWEAPCEQRNSA